jgi:GNAT superfamily N-acetyltransferase
MMTDSNKDIHITLATESDISALCSLLAMLFAQEQEFQPNRDRQQRGLNGIITHPELGCIWVAHVDEKPVGMVNVLYSLSSALGGKVALLEDMVVDPAYRRCGIGSRLLNHAVAQAQNHDCLRITLLTDQGNSEAQAFYRRHGFVLSSMLPMRLMLVI